MTQLREADPSSFGPGAFNLYGHAFGETMNSIVFPNDVPLLNLTLAIKKHTRNAVPSHIPEKETEWTTIQNSPN